MISPVSIMKFSCCRQLEHVTDVCVEHEEQDVVLVPVQLHGGQLIPGVEGGSQIVKVSQVVEVVRW